MQRKITVTLAGLILALAASGARAADGGNSRDLADALLQNTAAKAYLWTDKLGYTSGELVQLHATLDPMGDNNLYTIFVYLENIETGERQYFSPGVLQLALVDEAKDFMGGSGGNFIPTKIPAIAKQAIWAGPAPAPGLWHFVGELRSIDTSQVIRKAWAKFVVVAPENVVELNANSQDMEISADTTWNNDTIYKIERQVFVNPGATLTIEAGTLIQAEGQNAVLVIEKGAKIMAAGRREAPIVMTCDAPVGLRFSGCWAGLIVLGNARMTRGTGLAEGVLPEDRPAYGGDDDMDSSGVLRYVRVEFAGVDFNPETQPNAFGFHGIGSGTVIENIQAHEGEDDGIEFFGGTADCRNCVSSGAKDDSLDWAFGWRGRVQNLFILQDAGSDNGIEADNDSQGFDRTPRSHPVLNNVTIVSAGNAGKDGMRIRVGTAITARNVIVTGVTGQAVDVRDNSSDLFNSGASSIANCIMNGAVTPDSVELSCMDAAPMLRNVRYEGNPDPRPVDGSPAARIGAGAAMPSDGFFDTSAQCIGAFCEDNWLEEWTFFGAEEDYNTAPAR